MTDIVERLYEEERLHQDGLGFGLGPAGLCQEAAEEIERLHAENKRLRGPLKGWLAFFHGDTSVSDDPALAEMLSITRAALAKKETEE